MRLHTTWVFKITIFPLIFYLCLWLKTLLIIICFKGHTFHSVSAKKYIVETYTAKQSQIGKDPKVYLTLYDKDGDSGKRHLMKNEDGSALFKPSKVSICKIN